MQDRIVAYSITGNNGKLFPEVSGHAVNGTKFDVD